MTCTPALSTSDALPQEDASWRIKTSYGALRSLRMRLIVLECKRASLVKTVYLNVFSYRFADTRTYSYPLCRWRLALFLVEHQVDKVFLASTFQTHPPVNDGTARFVRISWKPSSIARLCLGWRFQSCSALDRAWQGIVIKYAIISCPAGPHLKCQSVVYDAGTDESHTHIYIYIHTYICTLLTYTCRILLALIEWWGVVSGLFGWHWPGRFRSSKHPRIYWIILGPIFSWLEFDILNTTLGAVPELWKMWMMNGSRSRDAQ